MDGNPASRVDDETLPDYEILWRRINSNPEWTHKETDGSIRPSSVAFLDNRTKEVSVNVASMTTKEEVLGPYPDQGLVSITAGMPREHGFIVAQTPEVADPSHRVICAPPEFEKKRKKVARQLAKAATWLVFPESYR